MKTDLQHIFSKAKKNDRLAQKSLFEMFSGKMLSVANSYINNRDDAEDVLMNAFYKAFTKLEDCKNYESFPFWLRKIVVNDSIGFIRKNKHILYAETEFTDSIAEQMEDIDELSQDVDLEVIFKEMPIGYKLVFNLSVFEEKKHQDIAEILNITEGTSKSQLSKAKKWLTDYFNQQNIKQNAESEI
ncbi:RNA polymerase sigma-70 factor (ECF subfamily) [Epilithonimonas hungarica]|uniref:RNA polymerase sigma factor n=1 Tax=Epilithonimonas hungarica TaxID=454006 RepID=UPI002787CB77|nr:sigma-70 family RNA polymerase sigma factor [Epilithonimonas hungarica]MDP9956183.1 RNA polymerase sigma-70 factor (ECF subfamily) [Epilithonimonas hungarica]